MPRFPFYRKDIYGPYLKGDGFPWGLKPSVYEGHNGPAEAGRFQKLEYETQGRHARGSLP